MSGGFQKVLSLLEIAIFLMWYEIVKFKVENSTPPKTSLSFHVTPKVRTNHSPPPNSL